MPSASANSTAMIDHARVLHPSGIVSTAEAMPGRNTARKTPPSRNSSFSFDSDVNRYVVEICDLTRSDGHAGTSSELPVRRCLNDSRSAGRLAEERADDGEEYHMVAVRCGFLKEGRRDEHDNEPCGEPGENSKHQKSR